MNVNVRSAATRDLSGIVDVHLRAFPDGEGQQVAALAAGLLDEATDPETISLVAEVGDAVIGHIAFSPVSIEPQRDWLGYILAPLGVSPGYQGQGIGLKLVETGVALLVNAGADILFVYGDPKYYRRFGFLIESASEFRPPYELQQPLGWQALLLNQRVLLGQGGRLSCVASLNDPDLW